MKKTFIILFVICQVFFITAIYGQSHVDYPTIVEQKVSPQSPPVGCQWQSQCGAGGQLCVYYPSLGAGCDHLTCENCYQGFVGKIQLGFDEKNAFVGKFYSYTYKGNIAERLIITNPGYLTKFDVKIGDSISRVNGKRLRKIDFDNPELYVEKVITVYTPGDSKSIRTILVK